MLLSLILSTAVGFGFFYAGFSESNIITVYILGVLLTAVWTGGHFYGAIASLLSVAAFNYFFTVPRFTFQAMTPVPSHISNYALFQYYCQFFG